MVNVFIQDPDKLLSKAQKDKLKERVKSVETVDSLNEQKLDILSKIHFSGDKKYDSIEFKQDETGVHCYLSYLPQVDTRAELKAKLKTRLMEKSRVNDPKWVMYKKLKSVGGRFVGQDLPSPYDIQQKKEFYSKEMEAIRNLVPDFEKNPMYVYMTECLKD